MALLMAASTRSLGILETTTQSGICILIRPARFDGQCYFLSNTGKLLCHFVPPGKHGGFAHFENPAHNYFKNLGLQI
jgi:hypothetical protein